MVIEDDKPSRLLLSDIMECPTTIIVSERAYRNSNLHLHSVAAIMHYDRLAFSKNGRDTLVAREPAMTAIIGAALDFSPIDLVKIQAMYNCASPPASVVSDL